MKQALVQILVIVANTKLRMFWAEVDKGSVRTVFGYGLGGPKPWVNAPSKVAPVTRRRRRKGSRLRFLPRKEDITLVATQEIDETVLAAPRRVLFSF